MIEHTGKPNSCAVNDYVQFCVDGKTKGGRLKKKIFNICMMLAIVLIIICGFLITGLVKGWFTGEGNSDYFVSEVSGISTIERHGVAYEVSAGTAIQLEDRLYTNSNSSMTVACKEKSGIYLNGDTEMLIGNSPNIVSFEVLKGEALVDTREWENVMVAVKDIHILLDKSVAVISAQADIDRVYVYAGKLTVNGIAEAEDVTVVAGNVITIPKTGSNYSIEEIEASNLNKAQITQLFKCGIDDTFCFTASELKTVWENFGVTLEENSEEEPFLHCTIKIVCDTILDNLDSLEAEKEGYIPADGIILETTTLKFEEGTTAFDALQKVCNDAEIQLEYSYTPLYNSYYIEGIHHLYEFDCGNESGWMYKVNGIFPNYGCSNYQLSDGDEIVWCYTCKDQGADVGGDIH